MIVDTSAIIAVLAKEPDGDRYLAVIEQSDLVSISAVTVLETRIVLSTRFSQALAQEFERLLQSGELTIVPFGKDQAEAAFAAFKRFGKGQGHPAQLNIMDCAAYALAHTRGEPLLFKGNDFARTDIQPAL
jgi:ribonuclease VapC